MGSAACEQGNPALRPDLQLMEELGLSGTDRVHTVRLTMAGQERAHPDSTLVQEGDYIQFVSDDWFLHEVRFDSTDMSCLLYTSPSPRDKRQSRMPSSA